LLNPADVRAEHSDEIGLFEIDELSATVAWFVSEACSNERFYNGLIERGNFTSFCKLYNYYEL